MTAKPKRVFTLGATGTIGRTTLLERAERGHDVVAFVRPLHHELPAIPGAEYRIGQVSGPRSLEREGFRGEHFDVVLSCLASRIGTSADAWRNDYQTHLGGS